MRMMKHPFIPIDPVDLTAVIGGANRVTSRDTSSALTLQLTDLQSQLSQLSTANSSTSSSSLTMAMMMMLALRR